MNSFRIRKINSDIGDRLRDVRLEKDLTLAECCLKCNIPIKYLKALENEDWKAIPGEVYLKSFLKRYCNFLGLNFKIYLNKYYKKNLNNLNDSGDKRVGIKKIILEYINPKNLRIFLGGFVILLFIVYIFFRINSYIKPPTLVVFQPKENLITSDNLTTIIGRTEKESMVYINGEVIDVSENGDFSIDVKLKYGLNKFDIITKRKHGRPNKKEVIILKQKDEGSFL
ncbi:MAG: helix-turn-helix domain-containing protein [Patescibacteria group bacterium]|nr:helix-turn-helix domain-containing protein [Patescibacteria group bacterium]MDD4304651.1 helix-turn-helix domain-containing protein [Patescibacteria group bacterium]MDD4695708.1 helix-turn-helix domain-containing protein [Patescibacteria group bacterium]